MANIERLLGVTGGESGVNKEGSELECTRRNGVNWEEAMDDGRFGLKKYGIFQITKTKEMNIQYKSIQSTSDLLGAG